MIESPVSRRSVARWIAVEHVGDVCEFVDELERGCAGELVFEGEATRGMAFVEDARICWAAAAGLARRLTELLVLRARVDAASMEALFRTCKADGVPLGEYLVGRGIVSASELRAALAQHTVESLCRLTGPGRRAAWVPRARGGYNPRFTFGTSEIVTLSAAVASSDLARVAEAELVRCFSDGDWGAAFIRPAASSAPAPIAIRGEAPAAARALERIAKWAVSALDIVAAYNGADPLVAVTRPGGRVLVAFRHHDLVIAGETGTFGPARLLNRRAQVRRIRG